MINWQGLEPDDWQGLELHLKHELWLLCRLNNEV